MYYLVPSDIIGFYRFYVYNEHDDSIICIRRFLISKGEYISLDVGLTGKCTLTHSYIKNLSIHNTETLEDMDFYLFLIMLSGDINEYSEY